MNIVVANDAFDIAGGENYALYVAIGLRKEGHNVILSPMEGSMLAEESRKQGFETIPIPYAKDSRMIKAVNMMTRKLKNRKIDIIHSNSNLDRTVTAFTAKRLKCKNVASIHSCNSIRHNLLHWYRNKYLINHFIPSGYCSKKILVENDRIPENKISVIHIGIPADLAVFSEEKRNLTRVNFNIQKDEILIGTVARLVNFKGINILIDAFKKLIDNKNLNNLRLLIVGDGLLKNELEEQSKRLGLSDKVIFTGHRTDLDNLLSAIDVYIQPSLDMNAEVFPITGILAKSIGLPMVVSDCGDLKYMVNENYDGFVVTPGDVNELTEKLSMIITNKDLRKNMGINSLENYKQKFMLEKMISSILSVYRKII